MHRSGNRPTLEPDTGGWNATLRRRIAPLKDARDSSAQPHKVVTVLAVTPSESDLISLRNLFSHTNWTLIEAPGCTETIQVLQRHPVPVVLCESQLPDGDWRRVLHETRAVHHPPALIVCCPHADDRLWTEVLNMGAYDLLTKPFERSELVRVISLAWRQWKIEWERCSHADHSMPARRSHG